MKNTIKYRTKSKVLVTALTVAVAVLLGACGANDTANNGANGAGKTKDASPSPQTEQTPSKAITVKIGTVPALSPQNVAKDKGFVEEEFAKLGAKAEWTAFQTGPEIFEAIAGNHLDFGQTGNIPVLSAQVNKVPFKQISVSGDGKTNNNIIVPKGSEAKSISDLKGKKIAVAKGSVPYNVLVRAIEVAGLKITDFTIVQVLPAEARPAFEAGQVDAWAIWEPFVSTQVIKNGARVLVSGEDLGLINPNFNVVHSEFAEEHPELVTAYLKALERARIWQEENQEETVQIYVKQMKLDEEVLKAVVAKIKPLNSLITDEIIEAQRNTAAKLHELGVLKELVDPAQAADNRYLEEALKK
ncbi:aliphatic sulfonate ABC transporter substrate-binding protein [Paenibacillus sp. GCM10023252]|uniref:aliphatic sulfonate ABC transporter substrate-binding protein n=1 Tax=Paenibacillus sp. GCM10023252 TaxID=3252649 RepID=UPI0036139416